MSSSSFDADKGASPTEEEKEPEKLQEEFLRKVVLPIEKSLKILHKFRNSNDLSSIFSKQTIDFITYAIKFNVVLAVSSAEKASGAEKAPITAFTTARLSPSDPLTTAPAFNTLEQGLHQIWEKICMEESSYNDLNIASNEKNIDELKKDYSNNCQPEENEKSPSEFVVNLANGVVADLKTLRDWKIYYKDFSKKIVNTPVAQMSDYSFMDPGEPYGSVLIAYVLLASDEKAAAITELLSSIKRFEGSNDHVNLVYRYRLLTEIGNLYLLDQNNLEDSLKSIYYLDRQIKIGEHLLNIAESAYLRQRNKNNIDIGRYNIFAAGCRSVDIPDWLKHLRHTQTIIINNFVYRMATIPGLLETAYPEEDFRSRLATLSSVDLHCLETNDATASDRNVPLKSDDIHDDEEAISDTKAVAFHALAVRSAARGMKKLWQNDECASLKAAEHSKRFLQIDHSLFDRDTIQDEVVGDVLNALNLDKLEKTIARELANASLDPNCGR